MSKGLEAREKRGNQAIGSLDNITELQAVAGQSAYQARRRTRFERRAEMARREIRRARIEAGLDPNGKSKYGDADWVKPSRRASCGLPRYGGGAVSVKSVERDGHARAHYSGLAMCGSIWACPVCSGIIRAARADEIREAARRHVANGGGLALATLTIRHALSDALEDSMRTMSDAFARMQGSRAYKEWRAEWGLTGNIKALELPYGRHGWHVHRHVLFFFDDQVKHDDEAALKSDLFAMWSRAVEGVGGRSVSFDAFDVQAVEAGEDSVASYVAKIDGGLDGLACEVALADVKAGRVAASLNPFQLLDLKGSEAVRLWEEYIDATKHKPAIQWSRGLRDALGMSKEKTDQEIVDESEALGDAVLLVERGLFRQVLAGRADRLCALLEAVERGDMAAASLMLGGSPYGILLDGGFVPMYTRFDPGWREAVA